MRQLRYENKKEPSARALFLIANFIIYAHYMRVQNSRGRKNMKISFSTNVEKPAQKKKRNKGVITGLVAGCLVSNAAAPITQKVLLPAIKKISSSIKPEDTLILNNAFEKAFFDSTLAEKGVKIIKITKDNIDEVSKELTEAVFNTKYGKKLSNFFNKDALSFGIELRFSSILQTVTDGENAFYSNVIKGIILPGEKNGLQLANFHEMGHAINHNLGKASRILQKIRNPIIIFGPAIILFSVLSLKDKKNEVDENGEKKKGVRQFIKNNAGILGVATFLPAVIEEGMASLKGNKIANKVLQEAPILLKKVKLTNAMSFASYAITALATGLGMHIAVKIKDNLQAKYEDKQSQKMQK